MLKHQKEISAVHECDGNRSRGMEEERDQGDTENWTPYEVWELGFNVTSMGCKEVVRADVHLKITWMTTMQRAD